MTFFGHDVYFTALIEIRRPVYCARQPSPRQGTILQLLDYTIAEKAYWAQV